MARKIRDQFFTTAERAAKHDALMPLLEAMFSEFKELSKKKPDGVLNKRKVQVVNRLLKDILTILEDEPTRIYLDQFDEDELPQNSDIVLMLSQFQAAMKAFREKYHGYNSMEAKHTWQTK